MTLTQITEKGIKDGEIINADIKTSADIAGSKINPNFGSQALTCGSVDSNGGIKGASLELDTSTVNYLYYTDALALTKTGHGAELVIDSSGQVGINAPSPVARLQVGGSVHVTASADNLGTDALQFSFSAPEGHIKVKNSTGSPAANLALHTTNASGNTNRVMHLSHDGKIGINISTPQSLLELSAATDTVMGIELGRAGDSITASRYIGICQTNNATNLAVNSGFSGVEFGGPASTREGYLAFHTHDTGVGSGERMCIDKSGQVGIGTASPDRLIHAAGATPILKLDSTNNEAYVQFVTASPSNTFYVGLVDSDIILQSSGASSTTSENLRIKANGRVGINNASPSGTLDISDPNGDNVTLILHTSATTNYIQLSDSVNAHSYIAKENNGNLSQVAFYASTSTGNGTGKVGHFDYRGLVLPAGKAISFSPHDDPFSQAPSPNNSNRLEDYEEGNFTPAITATGTDPTQSYVHQLGYYVKVGRIVTISVDIIFASSGISGGTNEAVLSNLPFNKANNTNHYGCTMAVGYSPNWGGTSCPTGGYINPNATFAYLMPYNSNGTEFSQAAQVGNGTRLIAGLTYMTN